jgi:hypothetical protein
MAFSEIGNGRVTANPDVIFPLLPSSPRSSQHPRFGLQVPRRT